MNKTQTKSDLGITVENYSSYSVSDGSLQKKNINKVTYDTLEQLKLLSDPDDQKDFNEEGLATSYKPSVKAHKLRITEASALIKKYSSEPDKKDEERHTSSKANFNKYRYLKP